MGKLLDEKANEFLDEAVYDVLNFLSYESDSKEDKSTWYSDASTPCDPSVLYDKDQRIRVCGDDYDVDLLVLDNNKLLVINDTGFDDDCRRYFIWYVMHLNASDYVLKRIKGKDDKITIILDNGKGNTYTFTNVKKCIPEDLDEEVYISKIVRPVTYEQFYERGHKEEKKETGRKRK